MTIISINKNVLFDLILETDDKSVAQRLIDICGPTTEIELIDFIDEESLQDFHLVWLLDNFKRYGEFVSE